MAKQLLTPRERLNLSNGRREQLKPQLPKDWRRRVCNIAPEYDCLDGVTLMHNVHQGRSSDDRLLDIWEQIIREDKDEKATINKRKQKAISKSKIAFAQ